MAREAVLTLAVLLVAALSPAPDTAGLSQGQRQERTRQPAGPDGGHNLAASTPSTLARRSAGHQVLPPTGPAPSSPLPAASRPSHGQPGVTRGDLQAAQSASIQAVQSASIQAAQPSSIQAAQSSSKQDLQSSSIQDRQSSSIQSIQDRQSSTPQHHQSSTPQDHQSSTAQGHQSSTPQDHQSSTPQDHQSSTPQDHQSSTPQDQSSTPQDQGQQPGGQSVPHGTDHSTWDCELDVSLSSSGRDQDCVMASSLPSPCVLGASGRMEWSGNGSRVECVWTIRARPRAGQALGLVLRFEDMGLQRGLTAEDSDKVTVYQGLEPRVNKRQAIVNGSLPVPPILLRSSHAAVRLEARSGQHGSSFALGYAVYLLDRLPPPAASAGPLSRYNCSSPYVVPEALRCDRVEQCLDGQDESHFNCSYPVWDQPVQFGRFDFKFVFPEKTISPQEVNSLCENISSSSPFMFGMLIDSVSKELAARITSLSGHTSMAVNLVRLRKEEQKEALIYRFLWAWNGLHLELQGPAPHEGQGNENCAILSTEPTVHFKSIACWRRVQACYVCMRPSSSFQIRPQKQAHEQIPTISTLQQSLSLHTCTDGSLTQKFHWCYSYPVSYSNPVSGHWNPLFRSFLCHNKKTVRFSVVSDGHDDCGDKSDEPWFGAYFHRHNRGSDSFFQCQEKLNPVAASKRCNGQPDCFDNSDEEDCLSCQAGLTLFPDLGCLPDHYTKLGFDKYFSGERLCQQTDRSELHIPGFDKNFSDGSLGQHTVRPEPDILVNDSRLKVLHMDGFGLAIVNISSASQCPPGYLPCFDKLCIPGYLFGTNVFCCQYHDDIDTILGYNCSGSYRCLGGSVCLDIQYLCDGIVHCPYKDDELYCDISCPQHCQCEGLEYKCQRMFDPVQHPVVRYLDLSGADQPDLYLIGSLTFVRFLNLSSCGLTSVTFDTLRLIVLDLSHNNLHMLKNNLLANHYLLEYLFLSGNPLFLNIATDSLYMSSFIGEIPMRSLLWLDLSNTWMKKIDSGTFSSFRELQRLDLSKNAIEEFAGDSLKGLDSLEMLVADDRRLCCLYEQQTLQHITCDAPEDELSSCSDLLWSSALRVALWLQAGMAVAGNVAVMVSRLFFASQSQAPGFRVLVVNLSVADLLMGLYLVIIGSADARLMGHYLWQRRSWTDSLQCRAAGFMSLLSSQVSVLLICFITLDRLLVLGFPFRRQLHLTRRSASVVCGVAWVWGLLLAAIPLLPATQHWNFYSQTGICLPLPITRHQFPGQHYSFAVFIVLNFVLFVLIGAGQVAIYRCIRSSTVSSARSRRQQDAAIARRLFLVAFSDWCCWFPVGVLGMLAAGGLPVPGQLNVWVAVLVLPLNSALNPFLYTMSGLLDTRRQRREEERVQRMLNKLHVDIETWPEERAMECYQILAHRLGRRAVLEGMIDRLHVDIETWSLDRVMQLDQILARRLGRATCSEDCMEPAQGATVSSEV